MDWINTTPEERASIYNFDGSSKDVIYKVQNGRITQKWYRDEKNGNLVIMNEWAVSNGEDDIDWEGEIVAVFPPVTADLAEINQNGKFYE